MSGNDSLKILVYAHSDQQKLQTLVHSNLKEIASAEIDVICLNQNSDISRIDFQLMDVFVLLYSVSLDEDESLYRVIKKIEKKNELERFLILPEKYQSNANHFPDALHSIRFQQHHLYFYTDDTDIPSKIMGKLKSEFLEVSKKTFSQTGQIIENKKRLQRLWQNTKIRTGVYLLPLFALLVFGFFKLLPQTLTLLASNDSFANIISPPEMNSYWLNESFDSYSNSLWKEKHIYKGTTPVNIDSINKEISILSELPVQEDIFQTSTTQSWPIDDLQALKISFKADSITELKAEVSIEVKIENAENQSLAVVCKAQPHENIGSMLCFIQDIEKKAVLSNEIPFTVGEWHTLTMVFIPNRFSVQFFLDNHFYGEIEIPSVEYWRDREFIVAFGSSVSNLEISPLSLTFDNILLSHQP